MSELKQKKQTLSDAGFRVEFVPLGGGSNWGHVIAETPDGWEWQSRMVAYDTPQYHAISTEIIEIAYSQLEERQKLLALEALVKTIDGATSLPFIYNKIRQYKQQFVKADSDE